ncbi:hypothetical protein SCLCIDRAFT_934753 [Scleroderma citrinum Foug A]|uniref:Uncharacterized protein n=1 Tax=Scleroderma citrinum Foug A TaxID=1036808 RepID=A0A0C2ZG99_9AGAM|nr:hypothetical protein SCLCIDRAFT_934753 [Scleroderma citrinum Foug A]
MHRASSVVLNVAPVLPQHSKPKGKINNCFRLFSTAPNRPQRVCTSKVSISDLLRSTNISSNALEHFQVAASCWHISVFRINGSVPPASWTRR